MSHAASATGSETFCIAAGDGYISAGPLLSAATLHSPLMASKPGPTIHNCPNIEGTIDCRLYFRSNNLVHRDGYYIVMLVIYYLSFHSGYNGQPKRYFNGDAPMQFITLHFVDRSNKICRSPKLMATSSAERIFSAIFSGNTMTAARTAAVGQRNLYSKTCVIEA
jgi:hypothetical protein